MQSSLHSPSHSSPLSIPWKKSPTNLDPPISPSLSKQPPSSISNLKLLIHSQDSPAPPRPLQPLPVVIRRAGRASRYCWDGAHLRLLPFDRGEGDLLDDDLSAVLFMDEIRRLCQVSFSAVRNLFVPRQVQRNYLDYLRWKFLHRVFSSALQVLATQAMFRAIGIGSSRSLTSAAALNWVLKDGLGRLSRCIYTASLGSAFDTNLKRVRFSTSILFSLSIGVELLTPMFPQYFLLLATTANIAKSISLAAYLATSSAIHRSFAVADNLGEVSAKAQVTDNLWFCIWDELAISSWQLMLIHPYLLQIQTVCFDNLGLMLAATLNDRLEIIMDRWIHLEFVPSPAEVSNEEGVFVRSRGSALWPIRIGCIDPNHPSASSVLTMQALRSDDFYFICMETSYIGFTRKQQACLVRRALLTSRHNWECDLEDGKTSDFISAEWFKAVEDSRRRAQREIDTLMEAICRTGWAVKNILLNTQEQIRYSFVDD
ncbi:hypothetical protein ACLOJK_041176 [Asimina triloba]